MDQASRLDDDDDSIAGRCMFGDVDDSERAPVRDLLVPLMVLLMMNLSTSYGLSRTIDIDSRMSTHILRA